MNTLHRDYGVNVVVPVYGLQSSPFDLRNRTWYVEEDIRTVTQIYNAYTANLPADHRVVTVSQSFGTYPHAAILVRCPRQPESAVFLSPLNKGLEFKAAGPLVYWFSQQTSWLQHVLLFSFAGPAPGRASIWDIVNRDKNLKMAARKDTNPEDSSRYGYLNEVYAARLEESLLPRIKGKDILVAWGDSDLYFSQEGFAGFAEILDGANRVETVTLENSGHMVLLDNGEEQLKARLREILVP